ncbi:hypothetical protein BZZ01_05050 [Nostocales cyanobacterium HT-58-2]|nr:hypothetical protein BZZ01_05050 [Nostocales cyanobacterium HT-58-2]
MIIIAGRSVSYCWLLQLGVSMEQVKTLVESLKAKSATKIRGLQSVTEIVNFLEEDFKTILEDMRKYLLSGSDTYRQIAIDWASDPKNGCELVKVNGRVVDIKEIEF